LDNLALQLYGQLIITFIGVFTPLLIILMNISRAGVSALEKIKGSSIQVMEKDIKSATVGAIDTKKMKAYIERMEKVVKKHKKSLRLLRPKRQFLRTFLTLLPSFLLLEAYITIDVIVVPSIPWVNEDWLLVGSIVVFICAMLIIWQILTTLIKVREVLRDQDYEDTTFSPQPTQETDG